MDPVQDVGVMHALAHWKVILVGQILSFVSSLSGAAQASLVLECNLSAPAFSIALMFFLLSFFLIPLSRQRKQEDIVEYKRISNQSTTPRLFGISLRAPVAAYFCLAILEVEANYITLLAYRHTALTSITLLDTLSLPSAMLMSRLLLHRRYVTLHLLGAAVCLVGVMVIILGDYKSDQNAEDDGDPYPDKILGDLLALGGALVLGTLNVYLELMVREFGGPTEYLGVVGFFGCIIASIQALVLERHEIAAFFGGGNCSEGTNLLFLLAYVIGNSLFYAGTSRFLVSSESALLNLSLLTRDLWSVTFSVVAQGIAPSTYFWIALPLTASGVLLYEAGPSPIVEEHEKLPQNETSIQAIEASERRDSPDAEVI